MTVRRREERRANVAGTHVIETEIFDRRASRGRARDLAGVGSLNPSHGDSECACITSLHFLTFISIV